MATKQCQRCKQDKSFASYIAVNSPIHGGSLPICRQCLAKQIDDAYREDKGWETVDKICQWADIPFIPEEWEKIHEGKGKDALGVYFSIFRSQPYNTLIWQDYYNLYIELQEQNKLTDALPSVRENEIMKLHEKWGANYTDTTDLEYLENLHQGLLNSQNVVGALNEDQALKLCKISLIIEKKIRAGEDFPKDLKSYDDLAKLANLTTKNVKDAEEFSSFSEVLAYLEKIGWQAKYYDGAVKDEVDFVQKDIKLWNQYLYVHETGVAEEIEARIQNLKIAAELEGEEFNEQELRDYFEEQENNIIDENEDFKIEV